MIRTRLLVVAVGAGVALAGIPALAAVDPGRHRTSSGEARALALLEQAAEAGRRLTYSGTQYVASWRSGGTWSEVVDLHHDPESGSVLVDAAGAGVDGLAAIAVLDPRMLVRLADSYSLSVAGPGRCAGREATVVEARRTGGSLAGRFWVDAASGVLLRREVFDADGSRVRSSAFLDLAVQGSSATVAVAPAGAQRPAPEAVHRLREDGWHVPTWLPDGFRLFETRLSDDVLHLAYTDGLSTLSLFAQPGRLGRTPPQGFTVGEIDDSRVWMRRAAPERVVWSGGGHVWTLVSDAPDSAVHAAVRALPRSEPVDDGLRARLARGLGRLGGMLNPF